MDLEYFPSSEAGKQMLDSVSNGFYDNSYVGKWLFQVMGLEMDEARRIVEELPLQAFPETATWGLRYHEQKYGLPVREELSYEERRRLIYQKRDERSPMNPYRMEVILENITGRKAHVDDESGPVNTFTVELESGNNNVDVTAAIKKLKAVKQSHVAFAVRITAVAHIELCGHIQRYQSRYPLCGTVPGVSTGLRIANTGVGILPEMYPFKKTVPMTGASGEAGQYPKTSRGLKVSNSGIEAEINAVGYKAQYPETSEELRTGLFPKVTRQVVCTDAEAEIEAMLSGIKYQNKLAGTAPKTSTGTKESEDSVVPEVNTESYQIRYPLCGNTFEI